MKVACVQTITKLWLVPLDGVNQSLISSPRRLGERRHSWIFFSQSSPDTLYWYFFSRLLNFTILARQYFEEFNFRDFLKTQSNLYWRPPLDNDHRCTKATFLANSPYIDSCLNISTLATSTLQRPLSSVPKVAVMARFNRRQIRNSQCKRSRLHCSIFQKDW